MSKGVVLDTGFLISLVDKTRPCHDTAKRYYKYFLDNGVTMFLPTVVAALKTNPICGLDSNKNTPL